MSHLNKNLSALLLCLLTGRAACAAEGGAYPFNNPAFALPFRMGFEQGGARGLMASYAREKPLYPCAGRV